MKKIIIGEIEEQIIGNPIKNFEKAIALSKKENFEVHTNDMLFVETLEVLCGESNIHIYFKADDEYFEMDCISAYDYLGDLYRILNSIRFQKELLDDDGARNYMQKLYDNLDNELGKYKCKYSKKGLIKEGVWDL